MLLWWNVLTWSNLELRSILAPVPRALGGRLARARLSSPAQGRSSPPVLPLFLNLSLLSDSRTLPSLAATTGRAAAPFVLVFAQPFAGDAHPPGMFAPSLFICCARRRHGAPQTLTKLFVFGSESSNNIYLLTSISFAKIIGCICWVRPWWHGLDGMELPKGHRFWLMIILLAATIKRERFCLLCVPVMSQWNRYVQ